jgi:dTDP-glucose 4,6-dehydratase
MRRVHNLLVTGGAGFIGSNFIRYLFGKTNFAGNIVNADKLTYAGNLENLADVDAEYGRTRYFFERIDIVDFEGVRTLFQKHDIDTVVHFAAESHVDRSIYGPREFIQTNILGTFNLLETAREHWKDRKDVLFHHVSTDEVYGSAGEDEFFTETTPYDPHSPYSASKAASDHLVRSYSHTYGLPVTLSNCSNNYGPYQFPEKMIPLMIINMLNEAPLPVYGEGKNVRDWLYVEDHASAIWTILRKGKTGETYNVGGEADIQNIVLVNKLCEALAGIEGRSAENYEKLITFVKDRPGHDLRYAIDCSKIEEQIGWTRHTDLKKGLEATIRWYRDNRGWVEHVRDGSYREWIRKNYEQRS